MMAEYLDPAEQRQNRTTAEERPNHAITTAKSGPTMPSPRPTAAGGRSGPNRSTQQRRPTRSGLDDLEGELGLNLGVQPDQRHIGADGLDVTGHLDLALVQLCLLYTSDAADE